MSCVVDDVEAKEDWLEHRVEWIWRRGIKLGVLWCFCERAEIPLGLSVPIEPAEGQKRLSSLQDKGLTREMKIEQMQDQSAPMTSIKW